MLYMNFSKSLGNIKSHEIVLVLLMVVYNLFNIVTPPMLSSFVNSSFGMLSLVVMMIILFLNSNPVVGVLGFVTLYNLIQRSKIDELKERMPSEKRRSADMNKFNQFDKTMEEEIVERNPLNSSPGSEDTQAFKPTFVSTELSDSMNI